mmetsp:Transcript_2361/g.3580  ORF Transcript_2361/g.3580 Transcript_2361/m.3580 type:complete len:174 (+) Transcript_2361:417-938(+)
MIQSLSGPREAVGTGSEATARQLCNSVWAVAKVLWNPGGPIMEAISAVAAPMMAEFDGQNISNLVWSFATMGVSDPPLMHAISFWAQQRIAAKRGFFGAQNLSNTAWSFASLIVLDLPLLAAIAGASLQKIDSWDVQELVNTAWAFSKLGVFHRPLFAALSASSLSRVSSFSP